MELKVYMYLVWIRKKCKSSAGSALSVILFLDCAVYFSSLSSLLSLPPPLSLMHSQRNASMVTVHLQKVGILHTPAVVMLVFLPYF